MTEQTTEPQGGRPRRVLIDRVGPLMVEGPVEIEMEDGTTATSDRFMVALCTCRRSRTFPFCDTGHRQKIRTAPEPEPSPSRDRDRP